MTQECGADDQQASGAGERQLRNRDPPHPRRQLDPDIEDPHAHGQRPDAETDRHHRPRDELREPIPGHRYVTLRNAVVNRTMTSSICPRSMMSGGDSAIMSPVTRMSRFWLE